MVVTDYQRNKNETAIHGNINNKEVNESINNSDTGRVKTKAWKKGTCLVTGDSMLGHIDENRMSRKFKIKVRPFPGAITEDMCHYLVPLLEKKCRMQDRIAKLSFVDRYKDTITTMHYV